MFNDSEKIAECYGFIPSILHPQGKRSISEWAAGNIVFVEPGRTTNFTTVGREFIKEPLDAFADKKVHEIVFISGSQIGKTGMLMAGAGWICANEPCRIFWAMPTVREVSKFGSTRLRPMLTNSAGTKNLIPKRKDALTLSVMNVGGAIIDLATAGTPSSLAGLPCRVAITDEVGKFDLKSSKEGDPINLVKQRTKSFTSSLIVVTSTPTIEESLEWEEFLKGDQRRYFMPCAHCGKEVVFAFSDASIFPKLGCEAYVKWDSSAKDEKTGKWDYKRVKDTAHFECPFCQGKITEADKIKMVAAGCWKPTANTTDVSIRSYQISSLYATNSRSSNIGVLAVKFLKEKEVGRLQGFYNGELAEPYKSQAGTERYEKIVSALLPREGEWCRILTADYHQNEPRLYWVCRAWNEKGDSYLVKIGTCNSFAELEKVQKDLDVKDVCTFIDSGFLPQDVIAACLPHGQILQNENAGLILDNKGSRAPDKIFIGWTPSRGWDSARSWIDENTGMKKVWGFSSATTLNGSIDMQVLNFNSNAIKDFLDLLRKQKAAQSWEVTDTAVKDTKYFIHLDAEVRKPNKAGNAYVWQKRHDNWANHWLDCEVQSVAAAASFGFLTVLDEAKNEG